MIFLSFMITYEYNHQNRFVISISEICPRISSIKTTDGHRFSILPFTYVVKRSENYYAANTTTGDI